MSAKRIKRKNLINFRDLGGMPAENGKVIKENLLFRSGKLCSLPKNTRNFLKNEIKVRTIIDLRIDTERNEHPDTVIDGVNYVRLPLLCTATTGITHDKKMLHTMISESRRIKKEFGSADNYMIAMYRFILFSEEQQQKLAQFLRLVLAEDGCVLWHCSAGKDRAGICAMLVEGILGVPESVIIQDFMLSKPAQRTKRFFQRIALALFPTPLNFKRILYGMMATKSKYIIYAINSIKEKYGSIENYCVNALKLTREEIESFKEKYLTHG